jgi:hypothetical protein
MTCCGGSGLPPSAEQFGMGNGSAISGLNEIGHYAEARGMTPEILESLLRDD